VAIPEIATNKFNHLVDLLSNFFGCRPWCKSFLTYVRVIDCGLLSGLDVRRFQKPRAGMVISGSGPNLREELSARSSTMVFPIQIYSIVAPIQVIALSHSPWHRHW
jgi:hypothetical protein